VQSFLRRPGPACIAVSILLCLALPAAAAGADAPERRTVVAGRYPAGALKRFMLGANYRDTWATPVAVEVLDLAKEAGGLTPSRRVGGQQTKGLALTGADGRSYTFRGLEKDASHLLDSVDEDLRNGIIADILNDQMSAQHPGSELVARGILEAAGLPAPDWRLVVLPDDERLGEFRKDFAGAVGVFAVYPQAGKGAVPGFLDATEIIDHQELYQRLQAGTDAADLPALLRARLVDILMGDWDRHRKQWRWARVPGNPLWVPIPEDRDQAFSRYEGFALGRVRGRDPRFQDFDARYPGIGGLTYNGWEQDRRLLVGFSREQFVRAAIELQARLAQPALEKAVRNLPPEWFERDGASVLAALGARRDALATVAGKYHDHLAQQVDVYLTDQAERVDARRLSNGDLDVTVRRAADGGAGPPTFHRVFAARQTEEVRFYTLGGDDAVAVTGGGRGPRVRMIGGKGDDLLDASGSGNAKLSDSEGRNRAVDAPQDARAYTAPPPPRNAPWIPPRDFTRESWSAPWLSYSQDLGAFVGYAVHTQSYAFRKTPFGSAHDVRAGYSFGQQSGRADYVGTFHRENRGSTFGLFGYASGVDVLRFYGFGNETVPDADEDFTKVNANQAVVLPTFQQPLGRRGLLLVGPLVKYTENDTDELQLVNALAPYGSGTFGELGLHGMLAWDGRDSALFPRKGVFAAVRGTYFPEAWDVESHFGQVNGNVNAYLSAGTAATLALRVGGKKVFGAHPYFEGAMLGAGAVGVNALSEPEDTLRGFRTQRFVGDASAWANSSLRLRLSRITLVVPGTWGVEGFADTGRVWLEGETSDTWHVGVGGGIWVSLLKDRLAFSGGIAHSRESDLVYVKGGFAY
jgi:hypothetical protein